MTIGERRSWRDSRLAGTTSAVLRVLVVACLVLTAGCSATSLSDRPATENEPVTPAPIPPSTPTPAGNATTTVVGDGWSTSDDPNPTIFDPAAYRATYRSLRGIDSDLAADFNAVVTADSAHDPSEKDVYAVMPTFEPELQVLLARRIVESETVSELDAGTANVLRYIDGNPRLEVDDELVGALRRGEWTDADGDRLVAPIERWAGTDPATAHSDDDQWTDFEELLVLDAVGLPDAHPTEDDVYVEVDTSAGATFYDFQRETLATQAFAKADEPVHWHFLENGTDDDLPRIWRFTDFRDQQRPKTFDYDDTGAHYMVVTDTAAGITHNYGDNDAMPGVEYPGMLIISNAAIERRIDGNATAALRQYPVFLFGRSFGLQPQGLPIEGHVWVGFEEHPSAMSGGAIVRTDGGARLAGPGALQYLDGEPVDEIGQIRANRYGAESGGLGRQFLSKIAVEEHANLVWHYPEHALAELETESNAGQDGE